MNTFVVLLHRTKNDRNGQTRKVLVLYRIEAGDATPVAATKVGFFGVGVDAMRRVHFPEYLVGGVDYALIDGPNVSPSEFRRMLKLGVDR